MDCVAISKNWGYVLEILSKMIFMKKKSVSKYKILWGINDETNLLGFP
jgi:hypothetical protein